MNLADKYAPARLSDIVGQDDAVHHLRMFCKDPSPCAFLFSGPTGTGKTSAALALAKELGVDAGLDEMGGLHQVSSGEQDGATVRDKLRSLHLTALNQTGWKCLVVNECDLMTAGAAAVWLDALDKGKIPRKSVIVFTTNDTRKLPRRFVTRCQHYGFDGGAMFLTPAVNNLCAKVWAAEGGDGPAPTVAELPDTMDDDGNLSIRQALQGLQRRLLGRGAPVRPTVTVPTVAPAVPAPVKVRKVRTLEPAPAAPVPTVPVPVPTVTLTGTERGEGRRAFYIADAAAIRAGKPRPVRPAALFPDSDWAVPPVNAGDIFATWPAAAPAKAEPWPARESVIAHFRN